MSLQKINLSLVLFGILVLAACSTSVSTPDSTQLAPTEAIATPTFTLATPHAQQPVAGICASFDGQTVEIMINIDIPSPRCAKVQPNQTLVVVNTTQSTIQVSLGRFSSSILPGDQYSIDIPFGEYLAPGVHLITVTPYFGAELWLETSK